jgi:hypothetical protein
LGLTQLTVLGEPLPQLSNGLLRVQTHKHLAAPAISRILRETRVGFLDYFDGYLGKSSVFAAYASHGLAPVLLTQNSSEPDGLVSGRHFLAASCLVDPVPLSRQEDIAIAAAAWYLPHNLCQTAKAMAARVVTNSDALLPLA